MTNCIIVWNADLCCFVGVGASNAQECSRLGGSIQNVPNLGFWGTNRMNSTLEATIRTHPVESVREFREYT